MTHTELLHYIRKEMKEQGIVWKKEEEFFQLLLPDENWKRLRSTWYYWKPDRNGVYKTLKPSKSLHLFDKIAKTLFLDPKVWEFHGNEQKRAVRQGVAEYILQGDTLDISEMIEQDEITLEQEQILEKVAQSSLKEIATLLEASSSNLTKTFSNQLFLLALLELLYRKGAYELLDAEVFPKLMPHRRSQTEVKVMEAHVLGSLKKPRYMEAVKLLESIEGQDTHEIIDLKTSAISNLRREHVANSNFSNEALVDGLKKMATTYHNIYAFKNNFHYYPAINLMYTLVLLEALSLEFDTVSKEELYSNAKPSMEKDKKSKEQETVYYASVSELEFLLLLGRNNAVREMENMLATLKPSVSLVERSKRQMLEFLAMSVRLGADVGELDSMFKKAIALLEDYEREFSHEA